MQSNICDQYNYQQDQQDHQIQDAEYDEYENIRLLDVGDGMNCLIFTKVYRYNETQCDYTISISMPFYGDYKIFLDVNAQEHLKVDFLVIKHSVDVLAFISDREVDLMINGFQPYGVKFLFDDMVFTSFFLYNRSLDGSTILAEGIQGDRSLQALQLLERVFFRETLLSINLE